MNQKIQDRKIKFSIDDDDQIFAKIPENLFLLCGFFRKFGHIHYFATDRENLS